MRQPLLEGVGRRVVRELAVAQQPVDGAEEHKVVQGQRQLPRLLVQVERPVHLGRQRGVEARPRQLVHGAVVHRARQVEDAPHGRQLRLRLGQNARRVRLLRHVALHHHQPGAELRLPRRQLLPNLRLGRAPRRQHQALGAAPLQQVARPPHSQPARRARHHVRRVRVQRRRRGLRGQRQQLQRRRVARARPPRALAGARRPVQVGELRQQRGHVARGVALVRAEVDDERHPRRLAALRGDDARHAHHRLHAGVHGVRAPRGGRRRRTARHHHQRGLRLAGARRLHERQQRAQHGARAGGGGSGGGALLQRGGR
eukprot:18038-Prorocentrum_minimum.AAC.2